ncbi:MAG: DUF58 domain-containing protein [Nitrososphaerales archaeon]
MKLTKRGKDYIIAILVGTIAATIIDIRIVLALCFSMLVAAAISELILARSSVKNALVEYSNAHVRCFKGEEAKVSIVIHLRMKRLIGVNVSGVIPPDGIEAIIDDETDANSHTISFKPVYAGRFVGLRVRFELRDTLQLFSKTIEVSNEDFLIDSYPKSMLAEIRHSKPMSVALGERTSGTRGSGLEFYSVDEYQSSMEKKNIFWKKIAAMPDETLLVKIRESNIPRKLCVALIQTAERKEEASLTWKDLACEAVALIGRTILRIGCDVEILFDLGGEISARLATDPVELSDAVMEMSTSKISNLDTISMLLSRSDICVTGFSELQTDLLALAMARKPSLLIQDPGCVPRKIGELAVIFSGQEDIRGLINRVAGL